MSPPPPPLLFCLLFPIPPFSHPGFSPFPPPPPPSPMHKITYTFHKTNPDHIEIEENNKKQIVIILSPIQ